MSCRVFIADDVAPLRALVREFLEEDQAITVVGEAGNGADAVAGVLAHRPDVLLLDLSMPGMDGLEVLLQLRQWAPETKVVVLSGFGRDRLSHVVVALGAVDYVEKGVDGARLRRIVWDAFESAADVDMPAARQRRAAGS